MYQRIYGNKVAITCIVLGLLSSTSLFCWGFQQRKPTQRRPLVPNLLPVVLPIGMTAQEDDTKESTNSDDDDNDNVVVDKQVILRGTEQDEFSPEFWDELEAGQPSEWSVMKKLLGINIFTYILAAAIAFFLSMNLIFGQGWLGSTLGIKGTGSFVERSEKLPNVVDLSDNQFSI